LAPQIPVHEQLLERGVITQEQLETARQKQWREGGEIEEHLVGLGYLAEEEMLAFLCREYHYRYLALEDVEIDRQAIHHIPAVIAHTYCLLPVRRAGNALAVAFADPLSREATMALNRVTDLGNSPMSVVPLSSDISTTTSASLGLLIIPPSSLACIPQFPLGLLAEPPKRVRPAGMPSVVPSLCLYNDGLLAVAQSPRARPPTDKQLLGVYILDYLVLGIQHTNRAAFLSMCLSYHLNARQPKRGNTAVRQ